jgi:hypothetical protein
LTTFTVSIPIFSLLSGIYNPLASLSLLILEVSWSHTKTHHSR